MAAFSMFWEEPHLATLWSLIVDAILYATLSRWHL